MNTPTAIEANQRFGAGASIERSQSLTAAAVAGWLGVGIFGVWDAVDHGEGPPYLAFSIVLVFAAALTVAAAWACTRPTERGTLRGWALGLGVIAVASAFIAWAGPLWMTTIAVSSATFAVAARQAVRVGLAVISIGQLAGIAVTIGAIEAEVGPRDSYGDYPSAFALGVIVAAAGSALGLSLLARAGRARESAR